MLMHQPDHATFPTDLIQAINATFVRHRRQFEYTYREGALAFGVNRDGLQLPTMFAERFPSTLEFAVHQRAVGTKGTRICHVLARGALRVYRIHESARDADRSKSPHVTGALHVQTGSIVEVGHGGDLEGEVHNFTSHHAGSAVALRKHWARRPVRS